MDTTHMLMFKLFGGGGIRLDAPALSSPADAAISDDPTPTFSWAAVPNALTYELQVASDAGFSTIVYTNTAVAGTSDTPGASIDTVVGASATLYWRVRAKTPVEGEWSEVRTLTFSIMSYMSVLTSGAGMGFFFDSNSAIPNRLADADFDIDVINGSPSLADSPYGTNKGLALNASGKWLRIDSSADLTTLANAASHTIIARFKLSASPGNTNRAVYYFLNSAAHRMDISTVDILLAARGAATTNAQATARDRLPELWPAKIAAVFNPADKPSAFRLYIGANLFFEMPLTTDTAAVGALSNLAGQNMFIADRLLNDLPLLAEWFDLFILAPIGMTAAELNNATARIPYSHSPDSYIREVSQPETWLPLRETSIVTPGNVARNVMYGVQISAELLTDPGLEAWTSSTNLTNWTETIAGTSTVNQETSDVHGGANAARWDVDASNSVVALSRAQAGLNVGDTYRVSMWAKSNPTAKTMALQLGSGTGDRINPTLTNAWAQYLFDTVMQSNNTIQAFRSSAASSSIYQDDYSVKKVGEYDGFYSGPTLNGDTFLGFPAPTLISTSFVQLENNRLESIFNPDLGSLSIAVKMNQSHWEDATVKSFVSIGVDANNSIIIYKSAASTLTLRVAIGGVITTASYTVVSGDHGKWIDVTGTWNRADNTIKLYTKSSTPVSAAYPTAGTWTASNLAANMTRIGGISTAVSGTGSMAHHRFLDREITASEIGTHYGLLTTYEPNMAP